MKPVMIAVLMVTVFQSAGAQSTYERLRVSADRVRPVSAVPAAPSRLPIMKRETAAKTRQGAVSGSAGSGAQFASPQQGTAASGADSSNGQPVLPTDIRLQGVESGIGSPVRDLGAHPLPGTLPPGTGGFAPNSLMDLSGGSVSAFPDLSGQMGGMPFGMGLGMPGMPGGPPNTAVSPYPAIRAALERSVRPVQQGGTASVSTPAPEIGSNAEPNSPKPATHLKGSLGKGSGRRAKTSPARG
jgi:hypothetical protein